MLKIFFNMITKIIDCYKIYEILMSLTIFFVIKMENISCKPIVKGLKIEQQEYIQNYSFMVSLQELKTPTQYGENEYIHLCGGTFIDEQWILTAAHCLYNRNLTNLSVQIGGTILEMAHQPRYKVEKFELYRFNKYTMKNDIALIRISPEYKNFICHLKLPYDTEKVNFLNENISCKILGFGATIYGGNYQNSLYEANVKLITNKECVSILGRIMGPQMGDNTVCAIGLEGEDVCQGDSGGPLICHLNENSYLYGIVSHGLNCGGRGIPSVYTMVAKYTNWIDSITF